ncbi:MAG: LPD38 domain-containing protein [candidate division WOR-3 bacterium]
MAYSNEFEQKYFEEEWRKQKEKLEAEKRKPRLTTQQKIETIKEDVPFWEHAYSITLNRKPSEKELEYLAEEKTERPKAYRSKKNFLRGGLIFISEQEDLLDSFVQNLTFDAVDSFSTLIGLEEKEARERMKEFEAEQIKDSKVARIAEKVPELIGGIGGLFASFSLTSSILNGLKFYKLTGKISNKIAKKMFSHWETIIKASKSIWGGLNRGATVGLNTLVRSTVDNLKDGEFKIEDLGNIGFNTLVSSVSSGIQGGVERQIAMSELPKLAKVGANVLQTFGLGFSEGLLRTKDLSSAFILGITDALWRIADINDYDYAKIKPQMEEARETIKMIRAKQGYDDGDEIADDILTFILKSKNTKINLNDPADAQKFRNALKYVLDRIDKAKPERLSSQVFYSVDLPIEKWSEEPQVKSALVEMKETKEKGIMPYTQRAINILIENLPRETKFYPLISDLENIKKIIQDKKDLSKTETQKYIDKIFQEDIPNIIIGNKLLKDSYKSIIERIKNEIKTKEEKEELLKEIKNFSSLLEKEEDTKEKEVLQDFSQQLLRAVNLYSIIEPYVFKDVFLGLLEQYQESDVCKPYPTPSRKLAQEKAELELKEETEKEKTKEFYKIAKNLPKQYSILKEVLPEEELPSKILEEKYNAIVRERGGELIKEKHLWQENLKQKFARTVYPSVENIFDRVVILKKYEDALEKEGVIIDTPSDAYLQARLREGRSGKVIFSLLYGQMKTVYDENEGWIDKPIEGAESYIDIISLVPNKLKKEFEEFLRTSQELYRETTIEDYVSKYINPNEDKESRILALEKRLEDIKEEIGEKNWETFKIIQEKLNEYNTNLLTYLLDNDIINKNLYDKLIQNKTYIPLRNAIAGAYGNLDGVEGAKREKIIQELIGSSTATLEAIPSYAQSIATAIEIVEDNRIKRTLIDLIKKDPKYINIRQKKEDENLDEIQMVFPVIDVFENGEKKYYILEDKDDKNRFADSIWMCLKKLNESESKSSNKFLSSILKVLQLPSKILRQTATSLSPDFLFTNAIRDQLTAFLYSEHGYIPFVDIIKGISVYVGKDKGEAKKIWDEYLTSGAFGGGLASVDREMLDREVKKIKNGVYNPLEILAEISETIEQATRISEFVMARKVKGIKESAYAAREITVDFSKAGFVGKEINRFVPFFNANLQGMYKLWQEIKKIDAIFKLKNGELSELEKEKLAKNYQTLLAFFMKTLSLYIVSRGIIWLNNNQNYQNYKLYTSLPDQEKQDNYIYIINDTDKQKNILYLIQELEKEYSEYFENKFNSFKYLDKIISNKIDFYILDSLLEDISDFYYGKNIKKTKKAEALREEIEEKKDMFTSVPSYIRIPKPQLIDTGIFSIFDRILERELGKGIEQKFLKELIQKRINYNISKEAKDILLKVYDEEPLSTEEIRRLKIEIPETELRYILLSDNLTKGLYPEETLKKIKDIILSESVLPSISIPPLTTVYELQANWSFFRRMPIESFELQGRPQWARYTKDTSETAKLIGKISGLSPAKVEYAIKSIFGGLGGSILSIIDFIVGKEELKGSGKILFDKIPILRSFVRHIKTYGRNAVVNNLYEEIKKINEFENLYKNYSANGEIKIKKNIITTIQKEPSYQDALKEIKKVETPYINDFAIESFITYKDIVKNAYKNIKINNDKIQYIYQQIDLKELTPEEGIEKILKLSEENFDIAKEIMIFIQNLKLKINKETKDYIEYYFEPKISFINVDKIYFDKKRKR